MSFDHCRWEYIRLNSKDDSLWESFPENLQVLNVAKRYVDAFRAPLQGLTHMQDKQVYALRACSLVAMLPPDQRTPPLGGFPKDLAMLNLMGWASLIQDVAQGMSMVPSNLSMEVYVDSMVLLQLLEATTGMRYAESAASLLPAVSVWEPTCLFPLKPGARRWPVYQYKEWQPLLQAPPHLKPPT